MASNNDDPAYKYITEKEGRSSGATHQSSLLDVDHGTFTKISYAIAWMIAIVGSISGFFTLTVAINDPMFVLAGIGIIACSWAAAAGVGTLAEISLKLTNMQVPKESRSSIAS